MGLSLADRSARDRNTLLAALLGIVLSFGFLVAAPAEPAAAATCPCTIFTATQTPSVATDPDNVPIELGVKFRADQDGFVTGIRFYKSSTNTGTHTGSLWSSSGTRLATMTFTGESGTGWQQANFASPVAVTANTTYVASYYAPNGHYAADEGYFANSGVTNSPLTALRERRGRRQWGVSIRQRRRLPQQHVQLNQLLGRSGVQPKWYRHHQADCHRSPASLRRDRSTCHDNRLSHLQRAGAAVHHHYDGLTRAAALRHRPRTTQLRRTVTLTPNANLAASTTYTVNLSGARDTANNQMDPVTWTFTTASSSNGCPCTIWPGSTVPATTAAADNSAVELGVKFRANRAGYVTGIRFYKGSGNTGTHVGSTMDSRRQQARPPSPSQANPRRAGSRRSSAHPCR